MVNCLSLLHRERPKLPCAKAHLGARWRPTPSATPRGWDRMSSRRGGSPRLETLPAKHRAALRGTEGHSGFLAALGASGASLDLGVVEVLARR